MAGPAAEPEPGAPDAGSPPDAPSCPMRKALMSVTNLTEAEAQYAISSSIETAADMARALAEQRNSPPAAGGRNEDPAVQKALGLHPAQKKQPSGAATSNQKQQQHGVVGGVVRLVPALVGATARVPLFLLRTSAGAAAKGVSLGLGAAGGVAGFVGDKVVMRTVRGLATAVTGGERLDAPAQAKRFTQQFQAVYGAAPSPAWVALDLQQACVSARAQGRPVLAYLHSPAHEGVEAFCRKVLCEPELVAYLDQSYVCWGGDVRYSDAHALSMRLGASTYPFLAVLSMSHTNNATIVKVAEGPGLLEPGGLLRTLTRCLEEHLSLVMQDEEQRHQHQHQQEGLRDKGQQQRQQDGQQGEVLQAQQPQVDQQQHQQQQGGAHESQRSPGSTVAEEQQHKQQQEDTRQLVREQDAEYEASLAADRRREAAQAVEAQLAEQRARQAAAEAAQDVEAKDAARKWAQERSAAIRARREAKKARLPPEAAVEPAAEAPGAAPTDGGGEATVQVALVRVRLPDGSTAQRSFLACSDLRALFDFVDSLDALTCWRYHLVSSYPRKVFEHPDERPTEEVPNATASLEQAGLAPHATLFVEPVHDP